MSEVNQETLERLVATTEQLLAALPVVASSGGEPTESLINYAEVVGYGDTSDPTINHVTEIISYEPVYQIKTNDYIIGGANGIANLQARALVGRTNYLKKLLNELAAKIDFERQISQLERQNMINALTMKKSDLPVDEVGMILEVFKNNLASAIDQTNAEVVSVIPGDDSVDIKDAKNLIKGGFYILTDGETSEDVQIKENLGTIDNGYRILFVNDVQNAYKNGKARLYRSSMQISDGRAYGGGILREQSWQADINFEGTNSADTLSAAADFSNGWGFELTGAVVDSKGQIILGEESKGVALSAQGWVRVNSEGDDLNA